MSIPEHLLPIWDAYSILNRARPNGFSSPQRIPLVDVVAVRSVLEIPFGIRFVRLVQAMDDVYLQHWMEESTARRR